MPLPRPDVDVIHNKTDWGTDQTEIKITRDEKSRVYTGTGISQGTATSEAVKKLLNDPHTAEFLPESKRP